MGEAFWYSKQGDGLMHIHSIQISNYKSFSSSEEIFFEPRVNLIAGTNNSGKTALLEALSGKFGDNPHKGPRSPGPGSSYAILKYRFTPSDLQRFVTPTAQLRLPCVSGLSEEQIQSVYLDGFTIGIDAVVRAGQQNPFSSFLGYAIGTTQIPPSSDFGVYISIKTGVPVALFRNPDNATDYPLESRTQQFASRIFHFKSERIGKYVRSLGVSTELSSDTGNLPEVIHNAYNSNSVRYNTRFIKQVNRVLPNVKFVSPQLLANAAVAIQIWSEEQSLAGPNISIPIEDSGTGVGQVLAILYVIEYMKPSIIIIDEPSSFLHPAATRELVRIFNENIQHQYFISTHAQEVFREVRPKRFNVLKHEKYETKTERRTSEHLMETFEHLGISPFFTISRSGLRERPSY